jgi:hypothetical protein
MDDIIINILWIKHGLWIIATIIWFCVNYFQPKEYGYMAGIGNLFVFGISTLCYMAFWIIWLIIF